MQTILIVDDHRAFRAFACRWLAAQGMVVVAQVGDGYAALVAARELRPSVVLLDIELGGELDGFEVARRLSDLPTPPAVVLMSGRDAGVFARSIGRSPARGFVPKSELTRSALEALLPETP